VKEEQEDRMLSELFRRKLGNSELIPSAHTGSMVMRRVARKEFMRFSPGRFNAWYAGGLIIAGAVLVVVLTTGKSEEKESVSTLSTGDSNKEIVSAKSSQNVIYSDIKEDKGTVTSITTRVIGSEKTSGLTPNVNIPGNETGKAGSSVTPAEVPSVADGGIVTGALPDRSKLQEAAKRSDNIIGLSVNEGCAPLKVIFKNKSLLSDSCRWSFGDGGFSSEENPEWIFDIEGDYEVLLRLFRKDGRQSFSSVIIKVHPTPVARFEILPENAVIPGDEITFINYSEGAAEFRWDFGDGTTSDLFEPRHSYEKYGNYNVRLIALSEHGCPDSLTVHNAFGSGYYVRFPNAFIPNSNGPSEGYYSSRSDEDNYVFHPVHSGVAEYQMRIFSRQGMLVFESNDVNIGWDGYYKGQLVSPGVYIWKVRGNYINGEPFTLMGDVTLLKNQ